MAAQSKASLQALFEQGDIPTGTNFSDLIDSSVNTVETSAQTLLGSLTATEFIAPRVSATNAVITGTMSAATAHANTLRVNASAEVGGQFIASAGVRVVTGDVSANAGTVYASAVQSTNGVIAGVGVVSAAGTTQGAAAILTNVVNRGKGIADGTTTGFAPLANRAGLTQYLFNEGASANLWPPTGGRINGLAADAVFPLAASAMVTIVHLTASAYAVK